MIYFSLSFLLLILAVSSQRNHTHQITTADEQSWNPTRSLSNTNMIIELNISSDTSRSSVCALNDGGFVIAWSASDPVTDYDVFF